MTTEACVDVVMDYMEGHPIGGYYGVSINRVCEELGIEQDELKDYAFYPVYDHLGNFESISSHVNNNYIREYVLALDGVTKLSNHNFLAFKIHDENGNGTEATKELGYFLTALEDCPVIDTEEYYKAVEEEIDNQWFNWGAKAFRDNLNKHDFGTGKNYDFDNVTDQDMMSLYTSMCNRLHISRAEYDDYGDTVIYHFDEAIGVMKVEDFEDLEGLENDNSGDETSPSS